MSKQVKYIGMDVHKAMTVIAVLDGVGKLRAEATIETETAALVQFVRGLEGTLHLTLEESSYSAWLSDVLTPHVAQVVVCDPRKNAAYFKSGNKSDKIDARKLADLLRTNMLSAVYHGNRSVRALQELARSYLSLVEDTTRVMNRLKAIYRGRGIPCGGTRVYSALHRSQWLERLQEAGVRRRAESRLAGIGSAAAVAPPGQAGTAGREPETRRAETVAHDSGDRATAGGAADRLAANAAPLPQQAAAWGLCGIGRSPPGQRRVLRGQRPHRAIQETGAAAGLESQPQSQAERDLQRGGRHRERALCRLARILGEETGSGDAARAGASDGRTQDRDPRSGALEERRTVRRRASESTSSLSVYARRARAGVVSVGSMSAVLQTLGLEGESPCRR